ncbi:MAG: flavin reductase family protein [Phycisphaerae bacterium]|nr:flavin reductase family protein [Phycisphaerae bacterium]
MEKLIGFPNREAWRTYSGTSVVMITAVDALGRADICTVGAWSLVNGVPPLYGIAMCTKSAGANYFKRHTTTCIEQTGEFVINVPDESLTKAWGICGTVSLTTQPDADKFALAGLTRTPAAKVGAPLIGECPVNIECRVHSKHVLPSHDWIVGEPLAIHWAQDVIEGRRRLEWNRAPKLV